MKANAVHSHTSDDIQAARQGNRAAFSRLVEPHRRELVAYCYRLTGSLSEADDLTQEVFVQAYKGFAAFEGRSSARAWLYRIAHNRCVNHLQRTRPPWDLLDAAAELAVDEHGASASGQDLREDVCLGFVALLQALPARQRAALVLRDVLGWSAEETARILETTVPGVKNSLSRARKTLAERSEGGDFDTLQDGASSDPAARELLARWVDAFEKGNTVDMVALLTDGTAADAMKGQPKKRGMIRTQFGQPWKE